MLANIMCFRALVMLLLLVLSPCICISAEPTILVSNKVPEGFEDLTGPQTTQVDVYVHNKYLISTLATYDLETLTFLNPKLIVDAIDDLIKPQIILRALNNALDNNTNKLCLQHVKNTDCGKLDPNIAGIIFDDGQFRVDLFINPLQFKVKTIEQEKYLPSARDRLSTMHVFNLNASGTDSTEDRYNAQATSLIAYGDKRLNMQSNYTNDEDLVIDEVSLQKDGRGWEAEAGVFSTESNASNFIPQQDILGFSAKSSINTRTDVDVTSGSQIFIFLNQRSRVEVFKDNRLIDAQFYNAGNRQLDTSRFPDGAYQISVRIREENGQERTEEYFFVRSFALPPDDDPHYFVEAGVINELEQDTTLPETSDNYFIQAGTAVRIEENLAVGAEIANTNNESMAQVGVVHLTAGMQTQANVMVTTENDWGVTLRENLATEKFTLNLDLRYINQGNPDSDVDEFSFVNNSFTQATSSITHNLLGGRAVWRYRHIDQAGTRKSETYSLTYRHPIYRKGHYNLDWEVDLNKDSDDYLVSSQINFTLRKNNNIYQATTEYQGIKQNNKKDKNILSDFSWQNTRQSPGFGRLQSRVFHNREESFNTSGININSESGYGLNQIELSNTEDSGDNIFGYSARSQFSLASNFKDLSIGGSRYSTSAIVVDLPGEPKGEKFEVFVDRQSVGYAEIGEKSVFPLPPYHTYEVSIAPRTESFVTYQEKSKEVTLYPGNVNALTWDVNQVLILIGQALNPDGTPVKNAQIQDTGIFSGTDERGWFQVEINKVDSLILRKRDKSICQLNLGEYDTDKDIHVFNELTCIPIDSTSETLDFTPERSSAQAL